MEEKKRAEETKASSMNKGRGEEDKWGAMKDLTIQKQRGGEYKTK